MKIQQQIFFWLFSALCLFLFIWVFKEILLPFVVGIAIAYLLNPLLLKLDRYKVSRTVVTIFILTLFLVIFVALCAVVVPPLYREIVQLAERAPEYFDTFWNHLQPYFKMVEETVNEENLDESIQQALKDNIGGALGAGTNLLARLLNGGLALVEFATFIIVTPLVAFFMMVEWQRITAWVDTHLPRHSYDEVKDLLSRIDSKISGFIRGQLLVAMTLGLLYALALSIAGLQYGFLIGIAAGALSVIPLFGSVVGLFASVGVAWLQTSDISFVMTVAGIFLVGQFLEGNFITPKLMGESVGLHPLWILFALMAGGAMFGIVGMVLAVPVAATAGVILSFMLQQYKDSPYYT